jgi:predicted DNA-binding transcriptional regulator AlpA
MPEILTVSQLAEYLQMTTRQIYSMCEERTRTGSMSRNPLPKLKINGNLRFARVDVEAWLQRERKAA